MSDITTAHLQVPNTALVDVTLHVPAYTCYGILGVPGSGKSALLNVLAGLHGVASRDVRIGAHTALDAAPVVGLMVPASALPNSVTPFQLLRDYGRLRGIEGPNLLGHCQRAVRWCALEPLANQPIGTFSQFDRLRTALALAIVHRPLVLFLDEPTTGLNAHEQQSMIDVIESLRDRNMTIVIATRGHAPLESLFDHIGVLANGRIIAELNGQQIRDLPRTLMIRTNDIPTAAHEHIQALDDGIIVTRRSIVLTGNGIFSLSQILQVLLHYNVHIFRIDPRNHPLADLVRQSRQPHVLTNRYPVRAITSQIGEDPTPKE